LTAMADRLRGAVNPLIPLDMMSLPSLPPMAVTIEFGNTLSKCFDSPRETFFSLVLNTHVESEIAITSIVFKHGIGLGYSNSPLV
jgi:hypothetical protein